MTIICQLKQRKFNILWALMEVLKTFDRSNN